MSINEVLNILLPLVFILVGVALIFFLIELVKIVRNANETLTDVKKQLDPMIANVEQITAKANPLMDRVQLTVDSLNLEMMRVDKILEDVGEITDTASSATAAVDNITNAPLKAVNNMASRVRSRFGGKDASNESEQLAEQRVAVAQALEDYKAAEGKAAHAPGAQASAKPASAQDSFEKRNTAEMEPITEAAAAADRAAREADAKAEDAAGSANAAAGEAPAAAVDAGASSPAHGADASTAGDSPVPGAIPVIDPNAIKDSPFFSEDQAE